MRQDEVFGGWLKQADLGGKDVQVTIDGFSLETVKDRESGKMVDKPALSFHGKNKKWLPNTLHKNQK